MADVVSLLWDGGVIMRGLSLLPSEVRATGGGRSLLRRRTRAGVQGGTGAACKLFSDVAGSADCCAMHRVTRYDPAEQESSEPLPALRRVAILSWETDRALGVLVLHRGGVDIETGRGGTNRVEQKVSKTQRRSGKSVADLAEAARLNGIPSRGAQWVVGDRHGQTAGLSEAGWPLPLPPERPIAVAAAALSHDQQFGASGKRCGPTVYHQRALFSPAQARVSAD